MIARAAAAAAVTQRHANAAAVATVAACAVAAATASSSVALTTAAAVAAAAEAEAAAAPATSAAAAAGTAAAAAAATTSNGESSSSSAAASGGAFRAALRYTMHSLKLASAIYCFYSFVGFVSYVDGPSMFPTFAGRNDWVFAEALPGVADRVRVGDVVIAARPIKVDDRVIKRVAAAAGDTVSVYRPGQVAPTQVVVPPGHVWLQGDNLILSRDSREYGPVPLALVQGRVVAQLLPYPRRITRTVG